MTYSGWLDIEDWQRGRDPNEIIGWCKRWGVTTFFYHDDGWTIASFNGNVHRFEPELWLPLPKPPEKV